MVGVEPLSVPAYMKGYDKHSLCLFFGGRDKSDTTLYDLAFREVREELGVDISSIFNFDTQSKYREAESFKDIPLRLDSPNSFVYVILVEEPICFETSSHLKMIKKDVFNVDEMKKALEDSVKDHLVSERASST